MDKLVFQAKYYEFAGFCLDSTNRELLKDGEHVQLTQKCFETLLFLVQNRGRMLQKDEILNSVWQENFVEEANLAQHIYMIRKALRNAGESQKLIETIPKYGYRFVGEVSEHNGQKPVPSNVPPPSAFLYKDEFIEHKSQDASIAVIKKFPTVKLKSLSINIAFIAAVLITIVAIVYLAFSLAFVGTRYSELDTLSVIPLIDIENTVDEKVRLGLAGVVLNRLKEQNRIQIKNASIGYSTRSTLDDFIAAGRNQNSDAVLFGSLHKANGIFHIDASIVRVRDREIVWSGSFDAKQEDLFALPESITSQIADSLYLQIPAKTMNGETNIKPEELDAFSAYAVGTHYFERHGPGHIELAIRYLSRAVEADPEFAAAAAGLADAYSMSGYNGIRGVDSAMAIAKAKAFAKTALSLDPDSSQAYSALAMTALFDNQFKKAKALFEKSVQTEPENFRARERLAWLLSSQDNLVGAIDEMRLAHQTKPESSDITVSLARLLRLNRQEDEALRYCEKALVRDPSKNVVRVAMAEIYEQKGQLDRSVKELQSVPRNTPEGKAAKSLLGRVYAKKGKKGEAMEILKSLKQEAPENISAYDVATIYAVLGDSEQAVKELQSARDDSLIHYLNIKYDYNIDSIRKSPDYSKILTDSSKKHGSIDNDNS